MTLLPSPFPLGEGGRIKRDDECKKVSEARKSRKPMRKGGAQIARGHASKRVSDTPYVIVQQLRRMQGPRFALLLRKAHAVLAYGIRCSPGGKEKGKKESGRHDK